MLVKSLLQIIGIHRPIASFDNHIVDVDFDIFPIWPPKTLVIIFWYVVPMYRKLKDKTV